MLNEAGLALGARIVLALVLIWSAVAKLRSLPAVRRQVETLVSERAAPIVTPLVPAAELVVAVALVAWWSAVPGVVALVLLAAFTVVVIRAEARRVPCLCFGSARVDAPVGPASVVRNGVLMGEAVFAMGAPSGAHVGGTLAGVLVYGVVAAIAVWAAR